MVEQFVVDPNLYQFFGIYQYLNCRMSFDGCSTVKELCEIFGLARYSIIICGDHNYSRLGGTVRRTKAAI